MEPPHTAKSLPRFLYLMVNVKVWESHRVALVERLDYRPLAGHKADLRQNPRILWDCWDYQ